MTVINPNSISGITSITLPSGGDNVLTIHTNDGTERFRIDSSGNVKVGSACTISPDGDVFFTGVCTATTLAGSGANLTALPAANLTGTLPAISGANLTGIAVTDNVRTGILDVAGIATFRDNVNVGTAVTITSDGIDAVGVGITCSNINGQAISGRRRLNINGDFRFWQRSASQSGLGGVNGYFTADRWRISGTGSQRFTMSQSTSTPTGQGFGFSMKIDCTTTHDFSSAGDYMFFHYRFEGQDLQMIEKGTANAKPLVVSFWVKSPKTGVHIIEMADEDNSRFNSQKYTVSSANTWEKHVVVFPGDTTGAFVNDTSKCCYFAFWGGAGATYNGGSYTSSWHTNQNQRAVGQVNIFDSTSNDFYMTGFQVEVGDTATAFEHRSYGEEELLCHRYFFSGTANRFWYNGHGGNVTDYQLIPFKTEMRAAPTITFGTIHTSTNVNTSSGSDDGHFYSDVKASSWQYSPLSAATGNTTGKVDYTASAEL